MTKKRVIVITGNGKGKTTAAVGTIIRSLGHKKKTAIIKFFKKTPSGEDKILRFLGVEVYLFGKKGFFNPKKIPRSLKKEIEKGWLKAQKLGNKVNLLVLDELNLALAGNLLPKEEVKDFIRKTKAHLIFTGRCAPLWLIRLADTVSRINEIKHVFKKGGRAEKGIEE